MADKIKKQELTNLNDKNIKNMILKLEDIKKENLKLRDQLMGPQKSEKLIKPELVNKYRTDRSKTPTKPVEQLIPLKEVARGANDLKPKSRNKEPTADPRTNFLEPPKPKLISTSSIGKDITDFTDLKRATINKLKLTTLEAIGSKENEIKARYMKRIEEIKPQVDKFQNLIQKLKEEKYTRLVKNSPSVFEGFEGKVTKKQEMFFKKMFLMHVDLIEDYDSYYNQLNQFQSLSSDFQKFNVRL